MDLANLIWNFKAKAVESRMIIDDTIETSFRVSLEDH